MILVSELQSENGYPGSKQTSEIGGGGVGGGYSKYFVGYGNNFPLVKQILKNRWWLSATENSSEE